MLTPPPSPYCPGPGPEPGKPTRPYSPRYRVRPTEHAQRRGRARRGGSACTLHSPGFSASRGWGQGAGRRTQLRGGESPFPPQPPPPSRLTCPRAPPAQHTRARDCCPPSPVGVPPATASLVDSHPRGVAQECKSGAAPRSFICRNRSAAKRALGE